MPCPSCKGMFAKAYLWRHVKNCREREPSDKSKDHQKRGVLLLPLSEEVLQGFKENVCGKMRPDRIRLATLNDPIILKFGQMMYSRFSKKPHYHQVVRQNMREIGRFLVVYRKKYNETATLEDILHSSNYKSIVATIRELAGFDEGERVFDTPTLATRVGQYLQKCAGILSSQLGQRNEYEKREHVDSLQKSFDVEFQADINNYARATLQEKSFNKDTSLPLASDVQKLHAYLATEAQYNLEVLSNGPEYSAWRNLSEITLAQLVLFNRRRGGEAERAELKQYKAGTSKEINQQCFEGLTDVEKKLVDMLGRFEVC